MPCVPQRTHGEGGVTPAPTGGLFLYGRRRPATALLARDNTKKIGDSHGEGTKTAFDGPEIT